MDSKLIALVAARVRESVGCSASCKGCGCKGGPGYRDRDGRCVAWADIERRSGKRPHADCTRECVRVVPSCAGKDIGILEVLKLATEVGAKVELVEPDRTRE